MKLFITVLILLSLRNEFSSIYCEELIDRDYDDTHEKPYDRKCDFERKCTWYDLTNWSYQKWVVHSGESIHRNFGTGPQTDNTLKNKKGHYLVTNISRISSDGAKLSFRSPQLLGVGKRCHINFYYHMFGTKTAKLSLLFHNFREDAELWSVTGDKGDKWKAARVFIGRPKSYINFQLRFEASFRKHGFIADIALDDISFSDCELETKNCSVDEYLCNDNSTCYKVWERCNGIYECYDKSDELNCENVSGSCDFNDNNWLQVCKWKHLEGDFQWSTARVCKSGPRKFVGDIKRHNTGNLTENSDCLYLNSTGHKTGDVAAVETPDLMHNPVACYLTYRYYMHGSPNSGPLRIYSQGTESGNRSLIVEYNGNYTQEWNAAYHVIKSEEPYKVIFEGLVGEPGLSDIAIDEVRFSPSCNDNSTTVTPPMNCSGFVCKNGECILDSNVQCDGKKDCEDESDENDCFDCNDGSLIPIFKVCDFKFDCNEKLDEENCSDCDFEDNLCGYRSDGFKRVEEQFFNNQIMIFETRESNSTALRSAWLRNSSSNCVVEFRYKVTPGNGSNCSFTVRLYYEENVAKVIFTSVSTTENSWIRLSLIVGSHSIFQIGFEVNIKSPTSTTHLSSFAIDDIKFESCGEL